ncbi:hypothetical protein Q3152_15925 [Clostridioides difficile]|uniref:hypothetical protein n=1 Tax=Clostridioides difficile TaxID=1496 RepID=UPI00038D6294|nr:hypothetical protein [Clostridioides difficile]EQJ20261.1 hypothetical protein QS3_0278 [Clostridioides difficile P13]ERM52246.1 hypothetical protein QUQ_0290 [Clostridioides difficile P68]MBH7250626.1 hypothetical protein [Clostridioides difficile]MBJ8544389.1 hypothetical protein [Clostridioides difficile]MBJ8569501.1 hypothetical protein [Clostridioides difficile]
MWEKFKNLNIFLKIILILVLIPITMLVLGALVAGWPIFLALGIALFLLTTGYKKKKKVRFVMGAILVCFVVYIFATADYSKENMARITNETRLKEEAKQKEKDKKELEKIKQEEKVKAEEQKKQEADKKTQEEQQKKKDEEAKKAEEEKTKNISEEKQNNKAEKILSKKELKEKVESVIPNNFKDKTTYYADLLTPTKGDGYIVSIQVEDSKFNNESECIKFTKEFVNNIKDIKNISSTRINFIVNGALTYNVFLDDWNNIKNNTDLIDNLDF